MTHSIRGTGETFGMMNSSKWLTTVDVLSSAGLIPADDYSEAYEYVDRSMFIS